jgi:hypothetical protein
VVTRNAIHSLSATTIDGSNVPLLCGGMSVFEINDWDCLGPHGMFRFGRSGDWISEILFTLFRFLKYNLYII